MALSTLIINLLVALSVLSNAVKAECPAYYRRLSQSHTYCKSPNPTCQRLGRGVTNDQINVIVSEHNKFRSKIAMGKEKIGRLPGATDMLEMVWDNELAAVAQAHADQCKFEHDCGACRSVQNFPVGQNLYQAMTSANGATDADWPTMVAGWYSEVKDFNAKIIPSYDESLATGDIGHFTQVIWSRSWRVGCGFTAYDDGNGGTEQLYTCNYGPGGNIGKSYVYTQGQACSQCPGNTCCSGECGGAPAFPGLCRVTPGKRPEYPAPPGDYIYRCDFTEACDVSYPTGMVPWSIYSTLSDSYASIVLKGGESSILNFTTTIPAQPAICWSVAYRKGPNVAGDSDSGEATVVSNWMDANQYKFTKLRTQWGTDFTRFSMSIPFKMTMQLSVKFEVPSGAPAQYFEISELSVKKGSC